MLSLVSTSVYQCDAINLPSPHFRRIVPIPQFLCQALMERHRARLRPAVIRHLAQCDETGHTGNRNHMSVVVLDHARQELLDHPPMRHRVDLECRPDLFLWLVDDRPVQADAGVIDQDSRVAVVLPNLVPDFLDVRCGGDVGFVEGDVGGCWSFR